MKKAKYNCIQKFIIRTPLYPIDSLDNNVLDRDRAFKECIFLASPELHETIYSVPEKQRSSKINNTLYKYISRTCTRCTPFGLFAGCSIGKIGDNTNIILAPKESCKRYTRLDMAFVCSLILKIENDKRINTKILFYPNETIYFIANSIRYIESKFIDDKICYLISSIESNEYILKILSKAQSGATIIDLAEYLKETEPQITLDDAVQFIYSLIEFQVLKSELSPSIVSEDIIDNLIMKLSRCGDTIYLPILMNISNMLSIIDMSQVGNNNSLYSNIIDEVNRLGVSYTPKYLFQTDLYKPVIDSTIDISYINDIKDYLNLIQEIGNTTIHNNLEKFKKAFEDRYGEQEIPLNIVLDKELGLGYPYNENLHDDINPLIDNIVLPIKDKVSQIQYGNIDELLINKFIEAIKSNNNEIILDENDFIEYRVSGDKKVNINVASVMCSILSTDDGERRVHIKSINHINAASLIGRFCHIDSEINKLVYEIINIEDNLNHDGINVEISHLPEHRVGNIAIRPELREKTIHYFSNGHNNESNTIYASDLMIKISNGNIVLRSKSMDCVIYPKLSCAHNYNLSTIPLYRLLCDLQGQNKYYNTNLRWNEFMLNLRYLPRVRYKNIIVSRQRWRISIKELADAYKMNSDEELLDYFFKLINKLNISKWVVIPESDNEMLVQFDNIKSIRNFLSYVKNKNHIVLEEFLFNEYNSIVKDTGSHFFANEMIFTLYKNLA